MKIQSISHRSFILFLCAAFMSGVHAHADTNLVNYLFENTSDTSLWSAAPAASRTAIFGNSPEILPVSQGRDCLEFAMIGASGSQRFVRTVVPIPVPAGTGRRIKLSFDIRSENCNPGDILVKLLQQDSSGGSAWVMNQPDYVNVAPSRGWVSVEKIGTISDTTTQLYVYLAQPRGENTDGKIWIDNISITLLSDNTDYLVEAYSGNQGNIFQNDTGTMTIRSNDPRYNTLSAAVYDHSGAPVTSSVATVSYSTVDTHKTATIAFHEKGFYTVQASPSGTSPFKTWSAATIGAPVATSAIEPLGMFSVNSDNPLAEAAGSKWNRFFLQTEVITGNKIDGYKYPASYANARGQYAVGTSAAWPSSMLYHSQSTNQKWIVCLRGIPKSLQAAAPVNPDAAWQYYNDEEKFKDLMTWVLKDLPPSVEYVEAMNEPEQGKHWGGTWTELGNYLKALKEAVNRANTGRLVPIKLLGPCFAHLSTTTCPDKNTNYPPFITGKDLLDNLLVTQNVRASLDGISMHAYNGGGSSDYPNASPEGDFRTRLNEFVTYIGTIGFGSKPLLFTEYGWQSGGSGWQLPVSEVTQADYTSRAMMMILSKYRATTFNLTAALSFALKTTSDTTYGYSFLNPDNTPRLPYVAYSRTAREIAGYSAARKLQSMGSAINAFTATDNSSATILALWSGTSSSSVVKLPTAASSARNLYGHQVVLTGTPKQLTIGGSPIFVTVDDSALGNWGNGPAYTISRGSSITVEFTDMAASNEFSLTGNTLSVSADTGPGARNIFGKSGSVWKNYNITVSSSSQTATKSSNSNRATKVLRVRPMSK